MAANNCDNTTNSYAEKDKIQNGMLDLVNERLGCCGCGNLFYVIPTLKKVEGCIPYVLHCGHSACGSCINGGTKTKTSLLCHICGKIYCLLKSKKDVQQNVDINNFPINFYLLGKLYYNFKEAPSMKIQSEVTHNMIKKSVQFKMNFNDETDKKERKSIEKCIKCKETPSCGCADCSATFCTVCFDKMHSFALMKSHRKTPLDERNPYIFYHSKCDKHSDKMIDLYCMDCKRYFCVSCVFSQSSQCRAHNIMQIEEKNTSLKEEMAQLNKKMNEILNCTTQSINEIKTKDCSDSKHSRNSSESIKNNIAHYFAKLHAAIQSEELNIFKHLNKIEEGNNSADILLSLNNSKRDLLNIIKAIDTCLHTGSRNQINFSSVINAATELLKTPCYLDAVEKSSQPKFSLNEDLLDQIQNCCKIEEFSHSDYKLSTIEHVKDTKLLIARNPSVLDATTSNSIGSKETERVSQLTNCSLEEYKMQPITKGSRIEVLITHINNPHHFYVQRVFDLGFIMKMTDYFASQNNVTPNIQDIQSGKLFITFDQQLDKWCRIVIIGKKNQNTTPQTIFFAKYIDFGFGKEISADSVKLMNPIYVKIPPLAFQCGLHNCCPLPGGWKREHNDMMRQIINSTENLRMFIILIMPNSFGVDLFTAPDTPTDIPFSITEAMIFLKKATFPKFNVISNAVKTFTKLPLFLKKDRLKSNDDVIITHVVNPMWFYVRKIESEKDFDKITATMNSSYDIGNEELLIYTPKRRMIVACYNSKSPGWYRGFIDDVQSSDNIQVQLVDIGIKVNVAWKHIRKLTLSTDLNKMNKLAIRCNLDGVTHIKKECFADAMKLMNDYMNNLTPYTIKVVSNKDSRVILNSRTNDKITCINEEMQKYISIDKVNQQAETIVTLNPTIKPTDTKMYVKVLSAKTPKHVYITFLDQEKELENMFEGIQKHYQHSKPNFEIDWKVSDECILFSKELKQWHRGTILEIKADKMAAVFLKDKAKTEDVNFENLREAVDDFHALRNGAVHCTLIGIIPAIGDQWANITCEYLQEIIKKFDKFHIVIDSEIDNILQVNLWVYYIAHGGALDPMIQEWRSVNNMIVEQGLAIRSEEHQTVSKDQSETKQSSQTVKESLPVFSNENLLPITYKIIDNWLPFEPPDKREFIGIPTYVDEDFNIYLLDSIKGIQNLSFVNNGIASKFNESSPEPHDCFWHPGQTCLVQWKIDSRFYRGQVLKIDDNNEVTVLFVDYGNTEICPMSTLRKNIVMEDIPIQAFKCRIAGIKPKGRNWNPNILDFVHHQIVENRCSIRVLGIGEDGIYYVRIKLRGNDLVEMMMSLNYGEYNDYPKLMPIPGLIDTDDSLNIDNGSDDMLFEIENMIESVAPPAVSPSLGSKDYAKFNFSNEYLQCTLIEIISYNRLVLKICLDNVEYSNLNKDMENMIQEIDTLGNAQLITEIFEGNTCVVKDNEKWHRAVICKHDADTDVVSVRLIDLGRKREVAKSDIRAIKMEWLKVPPLAIEVTLNCISLAENVNSVDILPRLLDIFVGKFYARIVSKEDVNISVDILSAPGKPLMYQGLIDEGILMVI